MMPMSVSFVFFVSLHNKLDNNQRTHYEGFVAMVRYSHLIISRLKRQIEDLAVQVM